MSDTPASPWDITGVIVFATGAILGILVTSLLPIRWDTWWMWPLVRVVWQLGGALWCGWALARVTNSHQGAMMGGFALLGFALSYNAIFDLARSPLRLQGRLLEVKERSGSFWKPTGFAVGYGSPLHTTMTVTDGFGDLHTLTLAGQPANRLHHMLERCHGKNIYLEALPHLGVVIDLRCHTKARQW